MDRSNPSAVPSVFRIELTMQSSPPQNKRTVCIIEICGSVMTVVISLVIFASVAWLLVTLLPKAQITDVVQVIGLLLFLVTCILSGWNAIRAFRQFCKGISDLRMMPAPKHGDVIVEHPAVSPIQQQRHSHHAAYPAA